jgi:hypothetical protein
MTLAAVVDEARIVLPDGEETALQGMFGKLGDLLRNCAMMAFYV